MDKTKSTANLLEWANHNYVLSSKPNCILHCGFWSTSLFDNQIK